MSSSDPTAVPVLSPLAEEFEQIRQELLSLRGRMPGFGIRDVFAITQGRPLNTFGVLGDMEIEGCLHDGLIVIEPYDYRLMGSTSYDVRLGRFYWKAKTNDAKNTFSPFGAKDVERHFEGPHEAVLHAEWCNEHGYALFEGIDPDEYIIPLGPGETILAHTHEFIGVFYGGTTMMKAKSSTGRIDISVCDDAGWGDVGYVNRWTLEVRNKHTRSVVALPVGMPFGQLIWMWVHAASINYGFSGHYQDGLDIQQIKDHWSPDDMLPRANFSKKNRDLRQILSKLNYDKR